MENSKNEEINATSDTRMEIPSQPNETVPKVQTFRISPRVKNDFVKIATELCLNQDATLSALTQLYETERAKELTGRAVEIENFMMHLSAISDSFRMCLQLNQDAEARVHTKYVERLEAYLKTIQSLQESQAKAKQAAEINKETLRIKQGALDTAEDQVIYLRREIEKSESVCKEYKDKNDTLKNLLIEYREDHEENRKIKNHIQELSDAINESKRNAAIQNAETQKLNDVIRNLTADNQLLSETSKDLLECQKKIDILEKEISRAIETIETNKKTAAIEKMAAVLESQTKYTNLIEDIHEKHNVKYRDLLDELELLRSMKKPTPTL